MDSKHRAPAVIIPSDRNHAPPRPSCGVPKNGKVLAPIGIGATQDHRDTSMGITTMGCQRACRAISGVEYAKNATPRAQIEAPVNKAVMTGSDWNQTPKLGNTGADANADKQAAAIPTMMRATPTSTTRPGEGAPVVIVCGFSLIVLGSVLLVIRGVDTLCEASPQAY